MTPEPTTTGRGWRYAIGELPTNIKASPRYAELDYRESENGGRVIGGHLGDVWFCGYTITDDGTATLIDVELSSGIHDMTEDEARDVADQIVCESFASIGAETIEHS